MYEIKQGQMYQVKKDAKDIYLWKDYKSGIPLKSEDDFFPYGIGGRLPPKTLPEQKIRPVKPGETFLIRKVLYQNEAARRPGQPPKSFQCLEVYMSDQTQAGFNQSGTFLWSVYEGVEKIDPYNLELSIGDDVKIEGQIEYINTDVGMLLIGHDFQETKLASINKTEISTESTTTKHEDELDLDATDT